MNVLMISVASFMFASGPRVAGFTKDEHGMHDSRTWVDCATCAGPCLRHIRPGCLMSVASPRPYSLLESLRQPRSCSTEPSMSRLHHCVGEEPGAVVAGAAGGQLSRIFFLLAMRYNRHRKCSRQPPSPGQAHLAHPEPEPGAHTTGS